MKSTKLPETAKDIFKLSLKDRVIFYIVIIFYKITGRWKYPVACSGDLETMTRFDKIYWRYKAVSPVKKAYKNSGLESFFANQHYSFSLADFNIQTQITISSVGDLMPHSYLLNSGSTLYANIHETIFGKDISMANLECVISPGPGEQLVFSKKTNPLLSYDPNTFKIVKGFNNRQYDFMATACNHSLDLGLPGIKSTVEVLKESGIAFNGVNLTPEDPFKATLIEKNGIRVGIICYTFGTNGLKSAPDIPYLVNQLDLNDVSGAIDFSQLEQQIDYCRHHKVDFIIIQLHWGYEFEFYPRPWQIDTAHHIAEMGVDCIIGHHPHVMQPLEYYRTKRDVNRIVPIYYSLGNLVNPFSAKYLTLSQIAEIKLIKGIVNGEQAKTFVQHAGNIHIRQSVDRKNKTISLEHADYQDR